MIVTGVSGLGCDRDPASDVKIIERPAVDASPKTTTVPTRKAEINLYVPGPPFRAELCKAEPEKSKGSNWFAVSGICAFQQTANVNCRAVSDDFYASLLRRGPGDVTISVYLNIETGNKAPTPGKYSGAQMFLTVQNRQEYYHWSSDSVSVTLGAGFRSVHIPRTRLEAEPPNTGTEIVSGTFGCDLNPHLDTTNVVR